MTTLIAAALALAAAPPVQAASGPSIPGGAHDPRYPGAEVYVGVPQRAAPGEGKACAVAAAYVDGVNAGRLREVADLFADDALLLEPSRRTWRGIEQIRSFYEGQIGRMRPTVVPVAFLGNDRECMVELASLTDLGGGDRRYALVSIDHFILDAAGKVATMVAFARPARRTPDK